MDSSLSVLTIDLGAIVANWRLLGCRAAPAACAAVVKANAYGLGMDKVAPALARAGCQTFFVATLAEGIALRRLIPEARIFVLNGPVGTSGPDFATHRLIPVLNAPEQVAAWANAGPAAVHLDSGMSRLGLDASWGGSLEGHDIVLAMSHMACADEPEAPMNEGQILAFTALCDRFAPGVPRSLAASSAIFLGPRHHFDLVRPGAALYGLNPVPGTPNPMAPVVALRARILQVRDVDTPMTVGYGATHRVVGKGRIATVGVGYADGWFRSLGNRGFGIIKGRRVPVVGRVSMDLTTFDVGALDQASVRPGDWIDLIGAGISADDVAERAGTIGYEVLTALGPRHERRFVGGTP